MELSEYKKCFAQEQIDEDWVWIIKNRVGTWVAQKGDSGYWDCVNIYSQYRGTLVKGLIRKDFAGLIVVIRPNGLKEGKTKEQLKGSMDHCPLSLKVDKIPSYDINSKQGKIISELRDLFESPIPQFRQEVYPDSVESRMKEYLEKRVATDQYASIYYGKTYCGFRTTMSIERYASDTFKSQGKPSYIYVIECLEGKISENAISTMWWRYGTERKIKIVIVSPSGFNERIKSLAASHNICLIRVNPKYQVSDNNILTPRMEGGSSVHQYEHKMLSDKVPMTVPLVIMDRDYTTTSLTDFLQRNGIPVNYPGCAHAPLLTRKFIEDVVSQIIAKDVRRFATILKRCGLNDKVPYCFIDPYKYAKKDGLKVLRSDLSKQKQLGHIDMPKKLVRLSDKLKDGDPRDRFSMGHEYGHHKLHSHPKFREFLERDAELEGEAASDIWEKHWLEVQANVFASYMLMPRGIVELLYNLYWRKWFRSDNVKPMYIKEPMHMNKDFQSVVCPIARHMGVSPEAMKITLIDMGLLIDHETWEIDNIIVV